MAANPVTRVLRRVGSHLRLTDRRAAKRAYRRLPPPPDFPGDDGSAGVREPRRPSPLAPAAAARAVPPAPERRLDLASVAPLARSA